MSFANVSITEFNEKLASKDAVPGGGGASALLGALAVSLGNMVGSLTVGKKKYADVEEDIIELNNKSEALRKRFIELIDLDAEGFLPLSKAYGLPSETDEEKRHKDEVMEKALRDACGVPLEIMEKCCEAVEYIEEYAKKGSRLALSDAGVGATFAKAALKGASLNIFINTKSMKDRAYAEELNAKAQEMIKEYGRRADAIFDLVYVQISE